MKPQFIIAIPGIIALGLVVFFIITQSPVGIFFSAWGAFYLLSLAAAIHFDLPVIH